MMVVKLISNGKRIMVMFDFGEEQIQLVKAKGVPSMTDINPKCGRVGPVALIKLLYRINLVRK